MSISERSGAIHANFFFVDIVGLSDPTKSTTSQIQKIQFLNNSIAACDSFKNIPSDGTLVLPTGDGMAIGFLHGPELPLRLAIELHRMIGNYNRIKLPYNTIQFRIGIHSGPVFIVKDIRGNSNIWGPGIIMARRIMDIGDEGHILLSARVAEDLMELSAEYSQILHPLERVAVKHKVNVLVYSAFGEDFGNQKLPTKIKNRINEFLYPFLEVKLVIVNPATMLVHHKRTYDIQNNSDTPTSTVTHHIATDIPKSFDDLRISVYDENKKPLKISSIELNTLHQKEFATTFQTPLKKNEKRRYYLEYFVEEPDRYFENEFYTNCKKFVLVFDHPYKKGKNEIKKPYLYDVDSEKDTIQQSKLRPKVTELNGRKSIMWRMKNMARGRSIRIEW